MIRKAGGEFSFFYQSWMIKIIKSAIGILNVFAIRKEKGAISFPQSDQLCIGKERSKNYNYFRINAI
jgi:hypothetical protein